MSSVLPYRLQRVAENYINASEPPVYFAHLSYGFWSGIGVEALRDEYTDGVILFGWLADGKVSGIVVAPVAAISIAELTMKGSGIEPRGKMVYWLIDSEGRIVNLPERDYSVEEQLRLAALNGDLDGLKRMLDQNPEGIESVDDYGRGLLEYATLGGRERIAAYLIEQGVDSTAENDANASVLDIAAESGWIEIVKLIAHKKPKNTKQRVQHSIAAANAFNQHHQELAIHLMELNAKLDLKKSNAGERALGLYANGSVKLARWVTNRFKIKGSYSKLGSNFLHAVAPYADASLLKTLAEEGASVTQLSDNGVSPLLVACGVGNREAICWFMENGGKPSEEANLDPIMYAVKEGMHESVSCLIDYGVSVNLEMKEGVSPLMYACGLGERAIAETLLDAGGLWILDSKYHDTSLRGLIRLDSVSLLKGLFEQGLPTDYKLFGTARIIEVAQFFEADSIVELMSELSGGATPELISASKLETRPKILKRTNVEYPFELEEKYGNVDVILKAGISGDGSTVAISVDDSVAPELASLVERSLSGWLFEPLELDSEHAIAVLKFKLPLRVSFDEKEVFSLNRVSELPRAILQVDPVYPARLREQGISGQVKLEWVIDAQGRVRKAEVKSSSHAAFEEPALESVKKSRWMPAKLNGVPVAVRVTQKMEFNPSAPLLSF